MTGPTGSGKTSTLYTTLQMLATEHVNVITVEDPVEYVLPNITQMNRYLNEIDFHSFRLAAIKKLTTGVTTSDEILRVLPRSSLYRKSNHPSRHHMKAVNAIDQ
jgi:type II secretory ATPase GspE/PulE/Tfp pilus assembly ATPase PilB-like protein